MSFFSHLGTMAFDQTMMERTIQVGRPIILHDGTFVGFSNDPPTTSLNLSVWFAFVPNPFRPWTEHIVNQLGADLIGRALTEETVAQLRCKIREEVAKAIRSGELSREGFNPSKADR